MTVVWTAEALAAIEPRTREALPPSKVMTEKVLAKRMKETLARFAGDPTEVEWSKLRALYLCANDEGRAKLRAAFETAWPCIAVHARRFVAELLRDPEKSREGVTQWIAHGEPVEDAYPFVLDLEQASELVARRKSSRSYYELVATFGDDILPLLLRIFDSPRDEFDLWHCARALALYDDPRAAEKLATVLKKAKIKPYASEFFVRFPHHAEAVLEPLGKGRTRLAEMARELLESARRRASAGPMSEEASPEELPPILVTPPWTLARRPALPKLDGERAMPARSERLDLDARLMEDALADGKLAQASAEPMPADIVEKCMGELHADAHVDFFVRAGQIVPGEVQLAWWDRGLKVYSYAVDIVDYMLAKHGARALDGLVRFVAGPFAYASEARGEGLLGVDSARLALAMLKFLDRRERQSLARRWFDTHAETAAFALVGNLLSGDESADRVMRMLAARGIDVVKAAEPWGEDAKAAVGEWLRFDRRNLVPKKLPKMPPAWKPETYTRPLLKNGKPIPLSAVDAIGVMLAISRPDDAYAGIEDVKAACDPRSLAEFAWDVARSWENGGAKAQLEWMRDALVWFADDEVVRRTTPAMKVDNVTGALGRIATPAAQMELVTIAAKGHWAGEQALRTIAEAKRMTLDELEDRIVPTAGLDERGEIELDYGPRKLRVGFDSHLEPYVVGDGGKTKALPPARKADDPDKVETAKRIWQDLKEDVGALATRRLVALERAMCSGRSWSAADFQALFAEHPLTKHIAKALVWVALPSELFRIAEDGTLADVHEKRVDLAGRSVRIAHPLRDGVEAVSAWQQLFGDYELVQPFPQISRTVRKRPQADRAIDVDIPPIDHEELVAKLRAYSRNLVRPMYAATGEVHVGNLDSRSNIGRVRITFTRKRSPLPIATVPEIDVSEAMHDVLD